MWVSSQKSIRAGEKISGLNIPLIKKKCYLCSRFNFSRSFLRDVESNDGNLDKKDKKFTLIK